MRRRRRSRSRRAPTNIPTSARTARSWDALEPAWPAITRCSAEHRSSPAPLECRAVGRDYFGTDGVRGIVGEFLTADLVERLGKASPMWSGPWRVFRGRETRASG